MQEEQRGTTPGQPIYANDLQDSLGEEGLAPVQPNFLSALLRRLPPRGVDTCVDIARWLGENQAILGGKHIVVPLLMCYSDFFLFNNVFQE